MKYFGVSAEAPLTRYQLAGAGPAVTVQATADKDVLAPAARGLSRPAYRADGLAGLGRAARADRGRSRFPEPLWLLVEGLALRTPVPSVAQVHRQVTAVAEREGWPVRPTLPSTRSSAASTRR